MRVFRVDETRVGQWSEAETRVVERGAVGKFARALGLTSVVHFDPAAARSAGYRDVVAPPTFAVTMLPWQVPGLELPEAGVLHGEQEFEWGEPLCASDELTVRGRLEDVKTRTGQQGRMSILTLVSEAHHTSGELAFRARAMLIVTEEGEHGGR
jgi:acyl dehydratase